jgi:hypothetical protein
VAALAYSCVVLSTDYIDACLERNEYLNPNEFLLEDKANEKKMGLSLSFARERAKENRNRLLEDRAVYCLENIKGGFESFRTIVEANGGKCMIWRNRKGTMVPSRRAESEPDSDDDAHNDVYLLCEAEPSNAALRKRFQEMAEGSRKIPRIVKSDWLVETAMQQKILPTSDYEVSD